MKIATRNANGCARVLLSALQGAYICCTSVTITQLNRQCVALDIHFTANNILQSLFAALFTQSNFRLAEATLVINFFNLLSLYFRHPDSPPLKRASIIAGPLSWVVVAIYWNGSMMISQPDNLVGGIFAAICIWSILCTGSFFAIKYMVRLLVNLLKLRRLTFLLGLHHNNVAFCSFWSHRRWAIPSHRRLPR